MPPPLIVTGASGFVGRHLIERALSAGWQVRAVSRAPGRDLVGVEWYQTDACGTDGDAVKMWGQAARAQGNRHPVLVHLAARAHVVKDSVGESSALYRKINVDIAVRAAEAAFERGVRRLVFLSSIGAVNDHSTMGAPLAESSICHPGTPYGQSKLDAELALKRVSIQYSAELVIVRAPLVHGTGAPGNLARMGRWLSRGIPLPLRGVCNLRSLIHVENLSQVLLQCAADPRAAGRLYHVRDPLDRSTPQILHEAARALGCKARLFYVPPKLLEAGARALRQRRIFEQLCGTLQVDDSLIRRELDWMPEKHPLQV